MKLKFDFLDQLRFTEGQCNVLALALHKETGWPLQAIWGLEQGRDTLFHVGIKHPLKKDHFLDILGFRSVQELQDFYAPDTIWIEDIRPEEIRRYVEEKKLHAPFDGNEERAAMLAKQMKVRISRRLSPSSRSSF